MACLKNWPNIRLSLFMVLALLDMMLLLQQTSHQYLKFLNSIEYPTSLLHLNFHLFNGCVGSLNFTVLACISFQEVVDELGIYIVSFDRPGYGESDPDPKRTRKSLALDIEELADELGLGSKFYVVGFSMGGQVVWSCLKYIPHR